MVFHLSADDVYAEMLDDKRHVQKVNGVEYPSVKEHVEAVNGVFTLSTLTNGMLNDRAYKIMEKKTGLVLADLGEGSKDVRIDYKDLQAQPRRYNTAALWSGLMNNGRAYCAYTYNVDRLVPWRTLTGRQHTYLDHDGYIAFGEHFTTYKPSPTPQGYGDIRKTINDGKARMLNVLTPHGKWHIPMRAKAFPGEDPMKLPTPDDLVPLFLDLVSPSCARTGDIINFRDWRTVAHAMPGSGAAIANADI